MVGDFIMEKDIEFLNYIYQNAKMGIEGIDDIKKHIESDELKKLISRQEKEYEDIADDAIMHMMVNMQMLKDDSESNIAKLMIEGSNKGVIQITEKLNHYSNVDSKIVKLAKKLLATEEHNIDDLKIYL